MKSSVSLIVFVILLFSCNSGNKKLPENRNLNKIYGEWIAIRIEENSIDEAAESPNLNLDITEKKISGTDGCNNYFGTIEKMTDNEISISVIGSTRKMCLEMGIPDRFNMALSKTKNYKSDGNYLVFIDKDGNELLAFSRPN